MYVTAYFTDSGAPKTGLSPTLDAYDISDDSKDLNGVAMTEIGGGFYKYDFTAYDNTKKYLFIADGGATLADSERYTIGKSEAEIVQKGNSLIFPFYMVLSTDRNTAATGKTIAGNISKDGGAFASLTNSISEISNGAYKVTLTATEMDANIVTLLFTSAGCMNRRFTIVTRL